MTSPLTYLACAALLCGLHSQPACAEPSGQAHAFPAMEIAREAKSDPRQFGPLKLDMSEDEVRQNLGPPALVSRRSMKTDSEEYGYTWDYSALGVTLFFNAFDESSPGTVMAIRAKSPCDWTAYGGLKIGMSIDAASKILERVRGSNVSPIGSVGTEYAGLYWELSETTVVARLEMGMVSIIYVGPNLP